jgi:hypothetical protein
MRSCLLHRCRQATWKTWLGVALSCWLLAAEAFAVMHEYDSAGHANGQACAVCVGAASFAAGNVAAPQHFDLTIATFVIAIAAGFVLLSAVPVRRYARGPPRVSFTF